MQIATGPSLEEVVASTREQLVLPREAAHDVGARRPDEAVVPGRARDDPCAGGGGSEEQPDEDEADDAHRGPRTSIGDAGFARADYDPVS